LLSDPAGIVLVRLRRIEATIQEDTSIHLASSALSVLLFLSALKVEPVRKLLGEVVKKKILFDELRLSNYLICRNEELFSFSEAVNFPAKVSQP